MIPCSVVENGDVKIMYSVSEDEKKIIYYLHLHDYNGRVYSNSWEESSGHVLSSLSYQDLCLGSVDPIIITVRGLQRPRNGKSTNLT